MRKRLSFFFLFLISFLLPLFCSSCKGSSLSIVAAEPFIVYDFHDRSDSFDVPDQYMFVFVRTENCDGVKSINLFNEENSLHWKSSSVFRAADDLYFAFFSPAAFSLMPVSRYSLELTDLYNSSIEYSFILNYNKTIAYMSESEILSDPAFVKSYAYFNKNGSLEIFGEIDKDRDTIKTVKDINGRRLCCISPDGREVCLFPYKKLN